MNVCQTGQVLPLNYQPQQDDCGTPKVKSCINPWAKPVASTRESREDMPNFGNLINITTSLKYFFRQNTVVSRTFDPQTYFQGSIHHSTSTGTGTLQTGFSNKTQQIQMEEWEGGSER